MTLLAGLTNQTIDTISSVVDDRYGDPAETVEFTNVACRWQQRVKLVVGANAEHIRSTIQVWLYPDYVSVSEDWKLTKGSDTYTVAVTEPRYDLAGNLDHIKLYLV